MNDPGASILIVDDEHLNRKLLETMLKPEGYRIYSVSNGEDALASVALDKPDLILLDVMMPGMNGYQVASELKASDDTSNIPIIMVTALVDQEARMSALKAGVEEFLTKPVDRAELWLRVRNLLRLKALGDFLKNHGTILEKEVQERTAELQTKESQLSEAMKIGGIGYWEYEYATDEFIFDDQYYSLHKITAEEAGGYRMSSADFSRRYIYPEDAPIIGQIAQLAFESADPNYFAKVEVRALTGEGAVVWMEVRFKVEKDAEGRTIRLIGINQDITERKRAEETLKRANHALRTLSAGNEALVRATREDELLQEVTSVIVNNSDYQLATVCYATDDPQNSIKPMAWSGVEDSNYLSEKISWADTEQGQLPIAAAIRSGKTQLCSDIAGEPGYAPWKAAALAHGYASNIAMPLASHGKTFGGLSIYSTRINAFDKDEINLLEELAGDLAYGITTARTRVEHEQQATILLESMEQSIETIADTVAARDPYTAGHQRRVSELATAIAQEMGLPEDQVNGIHLAAIIHDLGKIHVPSEFLSKPGKLSEIEFRLVKTHPQAGYDILKNVKFPWPIADIILQHHEKLNGTGYPQGLKGEQILLESRILTVADVVEAMSSHRPYRPALGIEPALNEIRRGRNSEYDATVVDVCLKLFTEKKFEFSPQ